MLRTIANRLKSDILNRIYEPKTTIFLCGKALGSKDSLRAKIADCFKSHWRWSFTYSIVYPEDLFEELLSGPSHQDLISLETVLAKSVDAVVLVPESYGAVAELGAFANHAQLRHKLVCVQDERFKKTKSFINYGPLRLLRDLKAGRIVYVDPERIGEGMERIRRAVSSVKRKTGQSKKKGVNAINADAFILPSVYIFEAAHFDTLRDLVKYASDLDEKGAAAVVTAGLSVLRKQGLVESAPEGYKYEDGKPKRAGRGYRLTAKGTAVFYSMNKRGRWDRYYDPRVLDSLRIEILTRTCRGKTCVY